MTRNSAISPENTVSAGPQAEIVDFLNNPETYGSGDVVERIETHAAYVFLVGPDAFKIKRAVRYDYLDYSTLSRRYHALQRELELNSPAAPSIYRDVVAITREADGHLAFDGRGDAVEWVLRMNRFRAEDELVNVAERGDLDIPLATALGRSIALYHAMAEPRPGKPGSVLIRQILDELGREFSGLTDVFASDDIRTFVDRSRDRLAQTRGLLDARTIAGHVRRCHGDLHLRNIVLIDGDPVPFDALEFDEELGTCDILYDLAFLLMDLHHRKLDDAANAAFNAYLQAKTDDAQLAGLAALPLFLGVRAAISAMVAAQTARARGGDPDADAEGRRYLAEACAALAPAAPALVAIGGLSGTGKTTLATSLAPRLGPVPGAVHLRSDTLRKRMLGVSTETRLPDSAYSSEMSAKVYARLEEQTSAVLNAGHAVIVDAVYLAPAERHAIAARARALGVPFCGLWLEAPRDVLVSRVEARRGDASDADARVIAMQVGRSTGDVDWTRVDASGRAETTREMALSALEPLAGPDAGSG